MSVEWHLRLVSVLANACGAALAIFYLTKLRVIGTPPPEVASPGTFHALTIAAVTLAVGILVPCQPPCDGSLPDRGTPQFTADGALVADGTPRAIADRLKRMPIGPLPVRGKREPVIGWAVRR